MRVLEDITITVTANSLSPESEDLFFTTSI